MRNKLFFPFLVIFLIAGFFRFWQLGTIPAWLSDDEARYIYNSYSLWKTGRDVAGEFLPLSINLDASFSPVYIYADAPFVGFFGLSPLTGRLPYTIAGFLSIIALYFLTKTLTKSNAIALVSAFVLTVSPWHIILSRGALDADFALFFYLVALSLFISKVKNGNVLWSIPFFLLAFYSYHATKIFFVFVIPLLLLYYRKYLWKRKKELVGFIIASGLILFSFAWVVTDQSVTRQSVLLWNNTAKAAQIVDTERTYSTAPEFLKSIFSNKLLYFGKIFRENYLEAFSPQVLFLYGDPDGIKKQFSLISSGAMYLPEMAFLLVGLYVVIRSKRQYLVVLLLLIAPLASSFSSDRTYVNRSIMMLPFLSILVSYGIVTLYKQALAWHKQWGLVLISFGIIVYGFFISSFAYHYFYRFPLTSHVAWGGSYLDLVKYLNENKNTYKEIYIDGAERIVLLHYAIYNNTDPQVVRKAVMDYPQAQIDGVHFIDKCMKQKDKMDDPSIVYGKGTLLVTHADCYPEVTPAAMITDKGDVLHTLWRVYSL